MKPPCDCTSFCGDDPDLRIKSVKPCEDYLDRTDPHRIFIRRLRTQASHMELNARYFEQHYPQSGHHHELRGAALITRAWAEKFQEAP